MGDNNITTKKIAIIGAGWYGCHLASALKKAGFDVTLFEKNDTILNSVSGNFGIRLHRGPHYQLSPETRRNCQEVFEQFCNLYPELVVQHDYSIYAHGLIDAKGNLSKVDKEKFDEVCKETPDCRSLNIEQTPYNKEEIDSVMNLDEPSVVIGERLRKEFSAKLNAANIEVKCNCSIKDIKSTANGFVLTTEKGEEYLFDNVINATGYQDFVPPKVKENFPVKMEVVYQPCLALKYRDLTPGEKPFSFIVMDGWFPCVMPCIEQDPFQHEYILTHGAFTIQASHDTPEKAYDLLEKLTEDYLENIKRLSEHEIERFWPGFTNRFEYIGVKKAVLAKIKTKTEFRSAVTFETDGIIHVIPGKINNVINVDPEVEALIRDVNCLSENGIRFMKGGILDRARTEIASKPALGEPNTCTLDTFAELNNKTHSTTSIPPNLQPPTYFKTPHPTFFSTEPASTGDSKGEHPIPKRRGF
ncbi:FAD-dependent oxidoreductase [Legionella clemsonensis]|uniref:Bifunctional tRNA (Mnm(5)s(2)U34)-methyltransferase/FAD-dependent cmnm(5)s(2)U34 oxidoreductase n=1 Tax=Legionella clemsonensis TaxID=1867846 RepID=A0A222P492_9GAMM|nr:FAD-dependent oxidoreductase [Legionella clemsonensis]ASQ46605.1 bifunctional tRNA (mnm(5)s(2)U34)-methyltransferase/FAD-dependent cmnm(5)s(2)U34 oxidoreductase [Legionella clemsonensis]